MSQTQNFSTYWVNKQFISPSPLERHRVTVRIPDVWDKLNSIRPHRNLNCYFQDVWLGAVFHFDRDTFMITRAWMRPLNGRFPSKVVRKYKSQKAAMKQFDAAVASGLYAKYEVVVELSVDHLTQEHDPS
jgi:hypothetical protein